MKEHRNISIADQIFEQLEREILSGKYRRGEILSELRLSKELDVSRTPIREALLRLEQENIVAESGRGMEVIGISAEDMLDLYDIRLHLEGEAARRAAVNITEEQLAHVLESLKRGVYIRVLQLLTAIAVKTAADPQQVSQFTVFHGESFLV